MMGDVDKRNNQKMAITSAGVMAATAAMPGCLFKRGGLFSKSGIKIGSFNLKNFKAHVQGRDPDPKYRKKRLTSIAKIIQSQGFAIVALQEVKDEETVEEICKTMNGGGNRYCGVHCACFYQKLFSKDGMGFENKTHGGAQAKGELAYIWDSDIVEPATDEYAKVVYREIETRVNHAWDIFFSGLAALLIAGMRTTTMRNDKRKNPNNKTREFLTDGAAIGAAAVAVSANQAGATKEIVDDDKSIAKEKAEAILQSQIRPSLVALFNLKHDANKQLRLINAHVQFGLTDADEAVREEGEKDSELKRRIRWNEAKFIAGKLFNIVDSQRSGKFETAFTLALGDFNLEPKDFTNDDNKSALPADVSLAQTGKSTVSVTGVKETDPGQKVKCSRSHVYDHFLFRSDVWDPKDATVMNWENSDIFFVPKQIDQKEVYYPVSDHCPVSLLTMKI